MAERASGRGVVVPILGAIIGLIGLWSFGFGAWLAALGGSIYYVLAGIALIAAAVLLFRRRSEALVIYAGLLVVTILWALVEVGFDFWQLAPRGDLLVPIGILLILPWLTRSLAPRTSAIRGPGLALSLALIASFVVMGIALSSDVRDRPGTLPGQRAQLPI